MPELFPALRVECNVDEEDHILFSIETGGIIVEPNLTIDSEYLCLDADAARTLIAWLEQAAKALDAADGRPSD